MQNIIRKLYSRFLLYLQIAQVILILFSFKFQYFLQYIYNLYLRIMEKLALDLTKLKYMIREGVASIPNDNKFEQAVLVIGDTGVGKSTILSYLSGSQLIVRLQGIKPIIDSKDQRGLKIGHNKFSETSVPTKIVINNIAFFDCPGFKDNKGEEYEIANSFFIQRLLDIYKRIKILLVIDQSHITEARADKLPKLIKSLLKSFNTFDDIKSGVIMIINRAQRDQPLESYHRQLKKLINLKNQKYMFQREERAFIEHLIDQKKIFLFRSAEKVEKDKNFKLLDQSLFNLILSTESIKSRHIQNILSESAKLAIRDYIDQIAQKSNETISQVCEQVRKQYLSRRIVCENNISQIIKLKQQVISLLEHIKKCNEKQLISLLTQQISAKNIRVFEEDFSSIMFFKEIYNKTTAYFQNIINKIYSEVSPILSQFDKEIIVLQRYQQERIQKQKIIKELENKNKQNLDQLKSAYENLDQEISLKRKLESDNLVLKNQLNHKLKSLQQKNNDLQIEKGKNSTLTKKYEHILNQYEQLKHELSEKSKLLTNNNHILDDQRNTNNLLTNKLNSVRSQFKVLTNELNQKAKLIQDKVSQLENEQKQKQEISNKFNQLISQFENLKISKQNQVKILKQLLDQQHEDIDKLKNNYEKLEFEYLEIQRQYADIYNPSKKSKYEEVVCSHFKNGGKCIHCINKWKKSKQEKNHSQI